MLDRLDLNRGYFATEVTDLQVPKAVMVREPLSRAAQVLLFLRPFSNKLFETFNHQFEHIFRSKNKYFAILKKQINWRYFFQRAVQEAIKVQFQNREYYYKLVELNVASRGMSFIQYECIISKQVA